MKKIVILALLFLVGLYAWLEADQIGPRRRPGPMAVATIRDGITSRAEVRALLGPPREVETQVPVKRPSPDAPLPAKYAAAEIWYYDNGDPPGTIGGKKATYTATIFIDDRGKVLECRSEAAGP